MSHILKLCLYKCYPSYLSQQTSQGFVVTIESSAFEPYDFCKMLISISYPFWTQVISLSYHAIKKCYKPFRNPDHAIILTFRGLVIISRDPSWLYAISLYDHEIIFDFFGSRDRITRCFIDFFLSRDHITRSNIRIF